MPRPIGPELGGVSDSWWHPTQEDSPVFLPASGGIRLSDILNMRVGCWRPAVYVEPRRTVEA